MMKNAFYFILTALFVLKDNQIWILENHAENEIEKLVSDLFFFFF